MSPKLPTLFALAVLLVGGAACGTLGKHYDADADEDTPPFIADGIVTAAILVDSVPSGALIRLNGIKLGPGPVLARPRIDESGSLVTPTVITADYSTLLLARGATDIVPASFEAGDLPPRKILLARPADGGVTMLSGPVPGN